MRKRQIKWKGYRLNLGRKSALSSLRPMVMLETVMPSDAVEVRLPDLSGFPTAVEKAAFILETAAEIEHALMVQFDSGDAGNRFKEAWKRARIIVDSGGEQSSNKTLAPQPA